MFIREINKLDLTRGVIRKIQIWHLCCRKLLSISKAMNYPSKFNYFHNLAFKFWVSSLSTLNFKIKNSATNDASNSVQSLSLSGSCILPGKIQIKKSRSTVFWDIRAQSSGSEVKDLTYVFFCFHWPRYLWGIPL